MLQATGMVIVCDEPGTQIVPFMATRNLIEQIGSSFLNLRIPKLRNQN